MSQQDKDPAQVMNDMTRQTLQAWQQIWQQTAQSVMPKQGHDTAAGQASFERMLEGLKGYCGWLESLSAASAAAPGGLRWDQALGQAFPGALGQPFTGAFAGMPDLGVDPEQWQQQFMKAGAPWQQAMQGWLGMPAFGLNREHQEQSQAMARDWLEYIEQSTRYQNLIARTGREAAERLQDKLAEHEEPGRQIDSLRGLYNLWVDAAEEAWAEIAMSDEYREVYAAMVNAQMRVRQHVQQQVAETSSQLGMPTREEVDSLGRRVHDLRRDVRESSVESLRAELAELRAELARLRDDERGQAAARSTRKTTRKTASKTARKTARKTAKKTARKTAKKTAAGTQGGGSGRSGPAAKGAPSSGTPKSKRKQGK